VNIGTNGTYFLKGGDNIATLEITVVAASLPGTDQSDTLTVARIANNLWDDIPGLEGYNGDTEYRCIYYKNEGATPLQFQVWIDAQPTGNATLQIGFDAAGVNGTATTIADEDSAPAGVTFSTPATEGTALSATLPAGQAIACWEKRAIVAGQYAEVTDAVYSVSYSVL